MSKVFWAKQKNKGQFWFKNQAHKKRFKIKRREFLTISNDYVFNYLFDLYDNNTKDKNFELVNKCILKILELNNFHVENFYHAIYRK